VLDGVTATPLRRRAHGVEPKRRRRGAAERTSTERMEPDARKNRAVRGVTRETGEESSTQDKKDPET
jgi:hypothetical protein